MSRIPLSDETEIDLDPWSDENELDEYRPLDFDVDNGRSVFIVDSFADELDRAIDDGWPMEPDEEEETEDTVECDNISSEEAIALVAEVIHEMGGVYT